MNLGSTPTKAQVHLHNLLSSNIRYFRQSTEDGCMIKKWHAEHGQELQPKHNLFRYGRSILVSPILPKQSRFFLIYRKVLSFPTSCLEPHPGFLKLLVKGIFDAYVLWPFVKKSFLNLQLYGMPFLGCRSPRGKDCAVIFESEIRSCES